MNSILEQGIGAIDVRDMRELLLRYIRERSVLDVGCAGNISERGLWPKPQTWLLEFIETNAASYVGIDIDAAELAAIKAHLPHLDLAAMRGDAFAFDTAFDVVILNWVLSYLNPFQAIECAKRCLKRDGVLLLGVTNMLSASSVLRALRKQLPYPDGGFLLPYEPVGLVNLIQQMGLQVTSTHWAERRRYSLGEKLLVAFSNYFRHYFMIVARLPNHALPSDTGT